MKEPWWSPGAITYTKRQVYWILDNIETIRNGSWPPEHKETGYTGGKDKPSTYSANYEIPIQIATELLQRIERCWPDGHLLLIHGGYSNILQVICRGEHLDLEKIRYRIKTALEYIYGNKRRPYSYKAFKNHKKRLSENKSR